MVRGGAVGSAGARATVSLAEFKASPWIGRATNHKCALGDLYEYELTIESKVSPPPSIGGRNALSMRGPSGAQEIARDGVDLEIRVSRPWSPPASAWHDAFVGPKRAPPSSTSRLARLPVSPSTTELTCGDSDKSPRRTTAPENALYARLVGGRDPRWCQSHARLWAESARAPPPHPAQVAGPAHHGGRRHALSSYCGAVRLWCAELGPARGARARQVHRSPRVAERAGNLRCFRRLLGVQLGACKRAAAAGARLVQCPCHGAFQTLLMSSHSLRSTDSASWCRCVRSADAGQTRTARLSTLMRPVPDVLDAVQCRLVAARFAPAPGSATAKRAARPPTCSHRSRAGGAQ